MVVPPLLRENPQFRRFWLGQTISLLGDQVSLIALPLVAVLDARRERRPDGLSRRRRAGAEPPLLAPRGRLGRPPRTQAARSMIATDLGRALLIGSIPVAYAFDALTFPHMLVVAFLMGTLSVLFHVSYNPLFVALVPRERFVEGGSIMHGSRALSRTSPGRASAALLVQVAHGARDARRRRVLLRRLGPLPPERRGRGAGARGRREGPRRRRRPLGLRQPDRPRRARRDRDDQLLQLRLLRALHPLRDEVARRRAGDARARARSRRGRQRPRRDRHRPRRPQDRNRSRRSRSAASSSRRRSSSCRSPTGRAG